jgi:hypothetical protein
VIEYQSKVKRSSSEKKYGANYKFRKRKYSEIKENETNYQKQYGSDGQEQQIMSRILRKTALGLAESLNLISRFSVKAQQKR